jgi:hypothetical protein
MQQRLGACLQGARRDEEPTTRPGNYQYEPTIQRRGNSKHPKFFGAIIKH